MKRALPAARRCAAVLLATVAATPWLAQAQGRPDPAAMLEQQRIALAPMGFLDGVWRGPAWTLLPSGQKHEITQTERIGPFLGGSVKVFEGRGYEADGRVSFNAFATLSYDGATRLYTLHSHALGHVGDFKFVPTTDGYVWEIPAGPGATIRYSATVADGVLHEVGDRLIEGQPPLRIFDMNLRRIGDTDWPAAGAVPMR